MTNSSRAGAVAESDPALHSYREDLATLHDMQQPLSALKLIFGTLEHRANVPPEDLRLLEIATAQTDELNALLADRLNRARGVPPSSRAAPQSVADIASSGSQRASVDQVVRSVIEPIQATKPGRVGYLAAARPRVALAPLTLRRVVANVVTNALEVTDPDGAVHVELRRIGRCAELLVDDSGAETGQKTPGHGIGLATSMAAVLALHGEMAFLRSPLGGVRVRLVLPEASP